MHSTNLPAPPVPVYPASYNCSQIHSILQGDEVDYGVRVVVPARMPTVCNLMGQKTILWYCSFQGTQAWEFSLTYLTLRKLTWVCDLGNEPKNEFFITWSLISMVFGFLPHAAECVVEKNFEARSKFKVGGGCFWAHMYF